MPRLPSIDIAVSAAFRAMGRIAALAACLLILPLSTMPASAQIGQSVTFVDAEGTVVAELDRDALEAIGSFELRTKTPWDDHVVSFEGPLLRDLVTAVGFEGSTIAVSALNDYSSEIPLTDADDFDVILAIRKDGEHMSIADMGPAFVVYPYDSDPRLRDRVYYARSVWQVSRITEMPAAEE